MHKKAIVVGGGVAGLLASRILTDHFDEVVILERDMLSESTDFRAGVPQAFHVHTLLVRGYRELCNLFPDLDAALDADGVGLIDWGYDGRLISSVGPLPRFHSNLQTRMCSRSLLEWHIRQQLTRRKNIQIKTGCMATGVVVEHGRVKGVQVAGEGEFSADLIVDASGRNSQFSAWLVNNGFEKPSETVINAHLGYATCWFKRPASLETEWQTMIIGPHAPNTPRAGVLYPIENDQWIVTLTGVGKENKLPRTHEEFFAYAQTLVAPDLYNAIRCAEPISPVRGFQRTENCWRHYEKLRNVPQGFVAIGDAVGAFNPVYGQGMTVATLTSQALGQALEQGTGGVEKRFYKIQAKIINRTWQLVSAEDFRWPQTEGKRPFYLKAVHLYANLARGACWQKAERAQRFARVLHFLDPSIKLLHPSILLPALRFGWENGIGR